MDTKRRTRGASAGAGVLLRVGDRTRTLTEIRVDPGAITYHPTAADPWVIDVTPDAISYLARAARDAAVAGDRAEAAAQVSQAMQSTLVELPPTAAAALAAQESHWRRIEDMYGMRSATMVGEMAGSRAGNKSAYASQLLHRGLVLAVKRRGENRFPAFQFTATGTVYPVIPKVIGLMRDRGWTQESIILWLTSPNGYMPEGANPADHLADQDAVLTAAEAATAAGL